MDIVNMNILFDVDRGLKLKLDNLGWNPYWDPYCIHGFRQFAYFSASQNDL